MSQINPNINNSSYNIEQQKQKQHLALNNHQASAQQPVRIPSFYYVPDSYHPSVKEMIKENPVYDMLLKPFVEHPIEVLGTWLVLGLGLDAYSNACSGEYERSLLKKAADLGDNIQNSKIVQSKPAQTVLKGFKTTGKYGKNAVQNSAILRAMKETPTMPEWPLVKSQMFNQKQEVVQDFIKITDALKLESAEIPQLKDLGINDYEKSMLKKVFNVQKISQIPEEQAVNQILLNRLGKTPDEIQKFQKLGASSTKAVKEEILKSMGLTTDKLKLIKDDVYGHYINDVKTATEKVKGKVRIGAGHYKGLGPLTKPFERTIGCDEIYNKLHSIMDGPKTSTGRFTAKMMQMIHRGLTFGGGKLGALIFIAPIAVEVAKNIKKADKDQKIGTAANSFVNNVSWVFTFPLALRILHAFGGIKHAGMGKDKVEQIRKLTEEFNKRVETTIIENGVKVPNPETFKTKLDYDLARAKVEKQIKALKTVEGQSIFTRGIRKLAGILTPDLCRLNSYRNSNFAANTARKLPAFFRNCAGIPIRVAAWVGLSMGVLDALLTKGTASIFGKSYDSMKQDERKDAIKTQEKFLKEDLNTRLYEAQRLKQYGTVVPQPQKQIITPQPQLQTVSSKGKTISETENENSLKRNIDTYTYIPSQDNKIPYYVNNSIDNYTYIPSEKNIIPHYVNENSQDNYTYIPSSECKIKSENKSEKERYIPSQKAANIEKTYDNSGIQSALDRAQKAEEKALRVLAGNFDGM